MLICEFGVFYISIFFCHDSSGCHQIETVADDSRMKLHHPADEKASVCTSRPHPPGTTVSISSTQIGLHAGNRQALSDKIILTDNN